MEKQTDLIYRFGEYVLAPHQHSLVRNGEKVRLRPKTFQVLVFLTEHSGNVVRREELLEAVWSNVHVTESVMDHSISEIREALNDRGEEPRFVETIPKVGYRFTAEVEALESSLSALPGPEERRGRWLGVAALFVVALVAAWWFLTSQAHEVLTESPKVIPFTTEHGREYHPSLSPDGSQIAYVREVGNGYTEIRVQLVGGQRSRVLTKGVGQDLYPVWSLHAFDFLTLRIWNRP